MRNAGSIIDSVLIMEQQLELVMVKDYYWAYAIIALNDTGSWEYSRHCKEF